MKLNEKILYYRKASRLSQEELAAQVGVSRQAVSKWELGESTPEVDKLLALSRAFGVTTDQLLSEDEPGDPPAPPPPEAPTASGGPAGDSFDRATGFLGKLIRRYGWLAGVYVALSGLGITVVGALARWGFGSMFSASGQMMGSMGFGADAAVTFSPGTSPEVQRQILESMGMASASPFGGIHDFFLGFATVILLIGLLATIAGVVLAIFLYRKGNKKS